jgi:uncharacterized protein YdaT
MDRNEQLEISHKVLKYIAGKHGLFLNPQFKKEQEREARAIGITQSKLSEWAKATINELIDEYV